METKQKKSETLSELVKKARKGRKLSARKLAELCEVSHTEINNIEKGIRVRPAVLTLKGFEKYLGLDYAELCRLVGYSEDTIKYGDCLPLFTHSIRDDDSDPALQKIPYSIMEQVCNYLKTKVDTGEIEVLTYSEFYNRCVN